MKLLPVFLLITMVLLALTAGCTGKTETKPATPVPTSVPTTMATEIIPVTQEQSPIPVTDSSLTGTWYLKLMSEQNGTAQVQMINPEMTVIFEGGANISGYSGCNNYMGQYTLTGTTDANGKGISIGPLASTMMYCADSATTETTYLQILQASSSYLVNEKTELSLMDPSGNALVYQRTPYSTKSVPVGS